MGSRVSLLLFTCFMALPADAVTVDRIAITVGNKVITESEIDSRVRLTAFENGEKPDFSPASRRAAADRLVDQKIVEHEMDVGHYPRLTGDARTGLLEEYARKSFAAKMDALDRALASYGVTASDLEDDLARQSDLLNFLSLRFRPAVQVPDQDVRQYFEQQVRPRQAGDAALNDDLRAQIERQLTIDRADADMEAWLKEQRKHTKIEYLVKDLAP